ncbi:hypothetical protein F4778DRAFT_707165 [Xylariomycetidae sp. FL2044]|nr:hypothetical protein F4778DRAFT_707165 [Xylariomycetidae sp. FL2044]
MVQRKYYDVKWMMTKKGSKSNACATYLMGMIVRCYYADGFRSQVQFNLFKITNIQPAARSRITTDVYLMAVYLMSFVETMFCSFAIMRDPIPKYDFPLHHQEKEKKKKRRTLALSSDLRRPDSPGHLPTVSILLLPFQRKPKRLPLQSGHPKVLRCGSTSTAVVQSPDVGGRRYLLASHSPSPSLRSTYMPFFRCFFYSSNTTNPSCRGSVVKKPLPSLFPSPAKQNPFGCMHARNRNLEARREN